MASLKKQQKELKRRFGKLAESMGEYYHHLDLRFISELDDAAFAFIMPKVKGVNMLDLNDTQITDSSIELLPKLEYLNELRLKECSGISNACIPFLNQIPTLKLLHVKSTPITIDGLLHLTDLPYLETLLFSDNHPEQLPSKMEKLKELMPFCEFIIGGKVWQQEDPNAFSY